MTAQNNQGMVNPPPQLHDIYGNPVGRVGNNPMNGLGLQPLRRDMSNPYGDGFRPLQVTGLQPFSRAPQQAKYPGGVEGNYRIIGGPEYLPSPQVLDAGDRPSMSVAAMGGSSQNLPRLADSQAALRAGIDGSGTTRRGMNTSLGATRGNKGKRPSM
jgi:hypothetical protein